MGFGSEHMPGLLACHLATGNSRLPILPGGTGPEHPPAGQPLVVARRRQIVVRVNCHRPPPILHCASAAPAASSVCPPCTALSAPAARFAGAAGGGDQRIAPGGQRRRG